MDRIKRAAVISSLADRLWQKGSWCSETHFQKVGYFLQERLRVPLGFDFVMYKHGPFSFDLRDELTSLRADGLLQILVRPPYGPSFVTTDVARDLQDAFPKTLQQYEGALDFVVNKLGSRTVADLERLATALFVTLRPKSGDRSVEGRARELHQLKQHIPEAVARSAVQELDRLVEDSEVYVN